MANDTGFSIVKRKRLQIVVVILLIFVIITGAVAVVLHLSAKKASTSEQVKITQNMIGSTTVSSDASTSSNSQNSTVKDDQIVSAGKEKEQPNSENKDMYIELSKGKEEASRPFEMTGMLPGDWQAKTFNLTVHNKKAVQVLFFAQKKDEEKKYADALDVEVKSTDTGVVLFSGTFSELINNVVTIDVPKNDGNATELNYTIKVSMDTEKDNQYQYGKLVADFKWEVAEKDKPSLEKIPSTGDTTMLYAIVGVAVIAVIALAICLSHSKKRGGGEQL